MSIPHATLDATYLFKAETSDPSPYSVTTDARRPGEFVLRFGVAPSLIVEVYRDLAAALIRADDLRRGIESTQWIVVERDVPTSGIAG